MTETHWKVEARMRAEHSSDLRRDGWEETDRGLWYHPVLGTHTICDAPRIQNIADIRYGRRAVGCFLIVLALVYGIITLITNWNHTCEFLSI
jgi:hypothetical protein